MSNNKVQLPLWKKALKDAYPKFQSIDPERALTELGFAMQLIEGNEYLQRCTPESIVNAILNIARTSVTLNPVLKLAYLVPRKTQCCLDFSYTGLIGLLTESGVIKYVNATVAYEDEEFAYNPITMSILHRPTNPRTEEEQNKRLVNGAYSRAVLPDGTVVYEYMPFWELEKIRLKSPIKSENSIWNEWTFEMYKKSVIRRHYKLLIGLSGIKNKKLQAILDVEYANIISEESTSMHKTSGESVQNVKNELTDLLALPENTIEYLTPTATTSKSKSKMNFDIPIAEPVTKEQPQQNTAKAATTQVSNQPEQETKPVSESIAETKLESKLEADQKNQATNENVVKEKTAPKEEGNPSGLTAKNDVRDLGEEFDKAFNNKQNTIVNEAQQPESNNDAFAFDLDFSMEQ
jgi:recombination protein RecT